MSLWVCSKHGLYGPENNCPKCGKPGRLYGGPVATTEQNYIYKNGEAVKVDEPKTLKEDVETLQEAVRQIAEDRDGAYAEVDRLQRERDELFSFCKEVAESEHGYVRVLADKLIAKIEGAK